MIEKNWHTCLQNDGIQLFIIMRRFELHLDIETAFFIGVLKRFETIKNLPLKIHHKEENI